MNYKNTTSKGYVWDKRIFWTLIILTIALSLNTIREGGGTEGFKTQYYIVCEHEHCKNPFYQHPDSPNKTLAEQEYLTKGAYGKKPPASLTYTPYLIIGLYAAALVLNHQLHNKGKQMHIEPHWAKKKHEQERKQ